MIGEVGEVSLSGDLLDLYSLCYEKRYRVKPILSKNGSDQTLAKDLIRQHGYATAREFIEAFLLSDYWTFTNKKHPLSALQKDINVVNADLDMLRRRKGALLPGSNKTRLKIRILRACDTPRCEEKSVAWEGYPEELGRRVACPKCLVNPERLLVQSEPRLRNDNTPLLREESGTPNAHGHMERLVVS